MKNKNGIIIGLVCLIAILSVSSCFKTWYDQYRRSMVSRYCIPVELKLSPTLVSNLIKVNFSFSDSATEKVNPALYDKWCLKHDDMSYDRVEKISHSYPISAHEFIAADYLSIEIASDKDWDSSHPAGTSLNDIVTFYAVSPIKYIKSGYTELYDWESNTHSRYFKKYMINGSYLYNGSVAEGETPFYPITKPVGDLLPEDMVLLGDGAARGTCFLLEFSYPTSFLGEERTVTVAVTTDEGEVFSGSITMSL